MDITNTNDIDINEYTDDHIQLNKGINPIDRAIMAKCIKSDIAKHL